MNMKRIIILLTAALALLAASCTQVEKLTVSTADGIAPVPVFNGLSATYTPATFYIDGKEVDTLLVNHFFAAVKFNDTPVSVAVPSKDDQKTNTVTAASATVNSILVSRGFENGTSVKVTFVLRAGLSSNANTGFIDSKETVEMSFVVKAASEELTYFADYSDYTETSRWSVIGKIASTGNGWDKDEAMKTNGEAHVCEGLELAEGDEFKFRLDADWGTNIGLNEDKSAAVLTVGKEYPALNDGGNLKVPEDGVYDLFVYGDTYVPEECTFKIIKHYDNPYKDWTASDVWSVIGSISSTGNGWNQDEPMISNGTWWVCRNLELAAKDEFKFRKDHDWGVNVGLNEDKSTAVISLGTLYTGLNDGGNLQVAEDGKYDLLVKPGDEPVFEICVAGTVPVFE